MMFKSAALLVTFLPALAWSCAVYDFCLCQNADNSFNDEITKKACANFGGNYLKFDDGRHYCGAGSAGAGIGGVQPLLLQNCRFKTACNNYGAAGDSNCWGKEWK
ncbi:uncharacterized protein ColSpa_12510 [Colletotrichum spaethianum]|uniref:Uncharacterized protein n=1 Tax=Colletotrichum spaethianum TaxID=700344 RepID=A0AA37PHM6_9PEZI|nr:uncharacterized protein ColSpa_12510 [Colletotrichum spaethianum]GKT52329.1 hypothetical protein ColSpa_12510 [Colletotrichum spaethianum]